MSSVTKPQKIQEFPMDMQTQEALVKVYNEHKPDNIITELSGIRSKTGEKFRFMMTATDILSIFESMRSKGYGVLPITLDKKFFEAFVEKYKLIDQNIEYKNKYNVRHMIPQGYWTGFSRRGGGKYDFFESRQEFLYTGSDRKIIKDMYKNGDKDTAEFLDMCYEIYIDCMTSYISYLFAYKNITRQCGGLKDKKYWNLYAKMFSYGAYPQGRLSIWNYTSTEPGIIAKPHLDSSLLNSVLYQDNPGLKIKKFEYSDHGVQDIENYNGYKSVAIKNKTMVLLGGRDLLTNPTAAVRPCPHMVESSEKQRISIGFDLNPRKFFEEDIKKIFLDAYLEKI